MVWETCEAGEDQQWAQAPSDVVVPVYLFLLVVAQKHRWIKGGLTVNFKQTLSFGITQTRFGWIWYSVIVGGRGHSRTRVAKFGFQEGAVVRHDG